MGNSNSTSNATFGSVYSKSSPRPGYYINNKKVYYQSQPMESLSIDEVLSFKKLGYSYAKSNKRVFFKGKVIPGVNGANFFVINRKNTTSILSNYLNNELVQKLSKLNKVLAIDFVQKKIYSDGVVIQTIP